MTDDEMTLPVDVLLHPTMRNMKHSLQSSGVMAQCNTHYPLLHNSSHHCGWFCSTCLARVDDGPVDGKDVAKEGDKCVLIHLDSEPEYKLGECPSTSSTITTGARAHQPRSRINAEHEPLSAPT